MSQTVQVLLILFLSIHCISTCTYNTEYALCGLSQFKNIRPNSPWTKIYVKNIKRERELKSSMFDNIPNVKELRVDGFQIETGSLEKLKQLEVLYFENTKVQIISDTFFGKSSVREVYLHHNGIKEIKSGTFKNLNNLVNISITHNRIPTLKSGIFNGLNIKNLILNNNQIEFIENNAFSNMKQLESLQLNHNKLTLFDSKSLINHTPSLKVLELNYNHIQTLTKDMLEGLNNLKYLSIRHNQIKMIQRGFLKNIKNLLSFDISNNNLQEFPANIFPPEGLNLNVLYIRENKLCFLSPDIYKLIPKLKYLSYGGNPWQCACWEAIDKWITENQIERFCDKEYKLGQRPECIINLNSPQECVYDKEKLQDIPEKFLNATAAYSKVENCED